MRQKVCVDLETKKLKLKKKLTFADKFFNEFAKKPPIH